MSAIYVFVGPYVECRSLQDIWPEEPELRNAWDELLNDQRRMGWNMPWGNSRTITINGIKMYQYCGVPIEKRSGVPRWPMLFKFDGPLNDSENFDWSAVDPGAEIEWFKQAYHEELAVLGRIFTSPLTFAWGLIYWPR